MELYTFQREALSVLREPKVNLALTAPTGSGKGRILEVLGADPRERILVLTPLLALARQQRLRFASAGVPAERVRILSPESALLQERRIREWRPTLVAVDEAHCVPEWGERFRPAYARLLAFLASLGCPRTLWMSATFPRSLLSEIEAALPGSWTTQGSFRISPSLRPTYVRLSPTERLERVREAVAGEPRPGLLFVGTRRDVCRYRDLFSGIRPVLPYHAGLSDEERRGVEARLSRESVGEAETSVIATNAFGMGMDFPQFAWAKIAQAPYSLLALMQAFGRVGRGGRKGEATLYWAEDDFRFGGLLIGSHSTRAADALADLRRYLEGSESDRRRIEAETFL
ncbi:MAG: hypothetical protein JST04_15405 [Bdellovibrionales bacterium]|nr:hypothetical protein [Bdellovibrionales bacterium]